MIHLPDEDDETAEVFSSPCSAPPIEPVPEVPFTQQETPVQKQPAQDGPSQEPPVQDSSTQESPVQETPFQEASVLDAASQSGPAQDEPPAQEALVQETPDQAAPVQDAFPQAALASLPEPIDVEPAPAFVPEASDRPVPASAPELSDEDTVPSPSPAYENVVTLPLPEPESRRKSFERQAEDSFRMAIGGDPKAVDGIVSAASETYQTVALAMRASAEELMTGFTRINTRLFEFGQLNAQNSMDFMRAISGVRNVQDAVDVQTAYLRDQYDAMASQLRELQTLTTEVAGKTTQPFKDQLTRATQLGRMC